MGFFKFGMLKVTYNAYINTLRIFLLLIYNEFRESFNYPTLKFFTSHNNYPTCMKFCTNVVQYTLNTFVVVNFLKLSKNQTL